MLGQQLLLPGLASAQTAPLAVSDAAEPAAEAKAGKVLRALRIAERAPRIDGMLDDEVWGLAANVEDFVQWEPDNMAALSERTVVRVAYDDRAVYVAVRCYDRNTAGVTAGLGRRDTRPSTDWIEAVKKYFSSNRPRGVAIYLLEVTRLTVDSCIEIASAMMRRLSGRRCRTPWVRKASWWRTISVATLRMVLARWSRLFTSQLALLRQSAR